MFPQAARCTEKRRVERAGGRRRQRETGRMTPLPVGVCERERERERGRGRDGETMRDILSQDNVQCTMYVFACHEAECCTSMESRNSDRRLATIDTISMAMISLFKRITKTWA